MTSDVPCKKPYYIHDVQFLVAYIHICTSEKWYQRRLCPWNFVEKKNLLCCLKELFLLDGVRMKIVTAISEKAWLEQLF